MNCNNYRDMLKDLTAGVDEEVTRQGTTQALSQKNRFTPSVAKVMSVMFPEIQYQCTDHRARDENGRNTSHHPHHFLYLT
jgi:hypothetical protein